MALGVVGVCTWVGVVVATVLVAEVGFGDEGAVTLGAVCIELCVEGGVALALGAATVEGAGAVAAGSAPQPTSVALVRSTRR